MIGSARKHYAPRMVLFYPSKRLLALFLDLPAELSLLIPCGKDSLYYLLRIYLRQCLYKPRIYVLRRVKGYEGIPEINILKLYVLDVILYILRIRSNDRAVEVIPRILKLIPLIE